MSRKNRLLIDKLQRSLTVVRVLVVVAAFLFLIATPNPAYAGSGAVGGGGTGGSGSGSGSGAWSKYGWGWAQYPLCDKSVPVSATYPSGNKCGPTWNIYQGSDWGSIYNTCLGSGSTTVDIFIINYWNDTTKKVQGSQGYEYHTVYEYPSQFAAHFANNASVDGGRATAINTPPPKLVNGKVVYPANPVSGTALDDWYQTSNNNISTTYQGTTYKFGATANSSVKGVAWFCSTPPPSNLDCTVSPANLSHIPENQNTKVTVTGQPKNLPNQLNWVADGGDGYYIEQTNSSDGEANSRTMNFNPPPPSDYTEMVHPPTGASSPVTYKFGIFNSLGVQIGGCQVQYHIDRPLPPGGVSATCNALPVQTPVPGNSFSQTYTIDVSNLTGSAANNYTLVAAPDGAGVTGATVTKPVTLPPTVFPSTHPQSITISVTANYAGEYTVTLFNPAHAPVANTPCHQPVAPQVSPYFQVWQNDAAAGGGFRTSSISCPGNYPAYVSPPTALLAGFGNPNSQYKGGIIANSASGSSYQSKSDFGAVALGRIPISPVNDEGFYANVGTTSGPSLRTWFANTAGSEGYLNLASSNHCVDDFYSETKINPTNIADVNAAIVACIATGQPRCQFTLPNDTTITGPINIPNGMQLTLYAAGNITIDGNINYVDSSGNVGAENVNFNPTSVAGIPYFALITQGNVYVKNNTTELDGLYVIQPTPNGSGGIAAAPNGVFATCSPGSQCNAQLVVNGSVIAQHVQLLRAHGASEGFVNDTNNIGNAPAEIFNFVPSMVLGAPAFASFCQPASACTQSAYSIAPVF